MTARVFEARYQIGQADLESVYNHVNHSRALLFLERARLDFLAAIGHSSPSLIERDIYPVITRVDVSYRRELFAGPITVTCEEGRIDGKVLVLRQKIITERGKEAVSALVESKFMRGATKRAIPLPVELEAALRAFFG